MPFLKSLTVISDEISQDLPVLRAFASEFQLPGYELRSFAGRAFKDLTRDDVSTIASTARAEGWKIFGCSTPVFKCGIDDAAGIREHREIFKRSLDVARALDCDLVRIFTFLRQPNPLEPGRLARVREQLLGLVELARGSGVRLGIENEHSCLIATLEEMQAILSGLPADSVGAIWDPCNVLYVPGAAKPTPENLGALGPRLFHVHVKDAIQRRSAAAGELIATGVPVGVGEVNWLGHLRQLQQLGYRGMLSMETHWRLQKIDESTLHLPAGYGFSQGGEPASRISLHNLKALVETL